jgi:hypothetical protein
MREFYRVLKPGGRMSLFEPINVLMSHADPDLFSGYDVTPVSTRHLRPLVETGTGLERRAVAYLTAVKQ